MSNALIVKLKEARKAGQDPRDALEDWLHARYKSNTWILRVIFLLLLVFVLLLGAAAMAYVMKSGEPRGLLLISDLASMDGEQLKWVIGIGLSLVLALFGIFLQLRNGQHKDLAALYLVMAGGDMMSALKLMFDGKGGHGAAVVEIISSVIGG